MIVPAEVSVTVPCCGVGGSGGTIVPSLAASNAMICPAFMIKTPIICIWNPEKPSFLRAMISSFARNSTSTNCFCEGGTVLTSPSTSTGLFDPRFPSALGIVTVLPSHIKWDLVTADTALLD